MVFYLFAPQFQGKQLPKGDINAYLGSSQEVREYRAETGEPGLWTGTSFGGMPTFQISQPPNGNQLKKVQRPLWGFMGRPAGYFFAGMLCCYLLLVLVGVNPWLSIVGALAAGLATNGFVLFKAGHMTKVMTVFYLPLIAAGILVAFRKRYVWGGLIFALGMGLALLANHPQMLYYFGITLPFFGVARLVYDARRGQLAHFGKATAVLVLGLLLALGSGAGALLTTQEYTAETMRGGQKLETVVKTDKNQADAAVPDDGLEWDYAMQWSNGWLDLLATYSPNAAGGGNGTIVKRATDFGQAMRQAGFQIPATFAAPTYHGSLPFTEGPAYLGAVVWALFLFGLFTARRPVAIWLGLGTLFIFLLSMGKNFAGMNRLLHDHLPLLSSFRAHSSALSISTFMMATLGVIGVNDWLNRLAAEPARARKQLLYAGVTAAVAGWFVAVVVPALITFSGGNDAATLQRFTGGQAKDVAGLVDALVETRRNMFIADAWRSFLFVGLTFGALILMFRKTVSPLIGAVLLAALVTVDFVGVNADRIPQDAWQRKQRPAAAFPPTAADQTILADPDPHFRVFNRTVNPFSDATTSYHHKSIGGYSAVKMRRIQDVIDGYLARNERQYDYNYPARQDQALFNMFNVKWFILPGQNGQPRAQQNPAAYGPAWLVSNIQTVGSSDEEFRALGSVPDLKETAIVHQEYADALAGLVPTGEGTVELTEYTPERLTYRFNSASEQFVVFSEMWYGPDLGWTLTVDGEPTELVRANYLLRGARVPAGQHTLVMEFRPRSYYTGKTLATICSLLIVLGILGYGGYQLYRMRSEEATV